MPQLARKTSTRQRWHLRVSLFCFHDVNRRIPRRPMQRRIAPCCFWSTTWTRSKRTHDGLASCLRGTNSFTSRRFACVLSPASPSTPSLRASAPPPRTVLTPTRLLPSIHPGRTHAAARSSRTPSSPSKRDVFLGPSSWRTAHKPTNRWTPPVTVRQRDREHGQTASMQAVRGASRRSFAAEWDHVAAKYLAVGDIMARAAPPNVSYC